MLGEPTPVTPVRPTPFSALAAAAAAYSAGLQQHSAPGPWSLGHYPGSIFPGALPPGAFNPGLSNSAGKFRIVFYLSWIKPPADLSQHFTMNLVVLNCTEGKFNKVSSKII